MKNSTKVQIATIGGLAAALLLVFTGCDDDTPQVDNSCRCDATAKANHYLPCACTQSDCNNACCPQIARGSFGTIPVYQTSAVTDEVAIQAATRIGNAYALVGEKTKKYVDANITKVEIGTTTAINGSVLTIANATPANIATAIDGLVPADYVGKAHDNGSHRVPDTRIV